MRTPRRTASLPARTGGRATRPGRLARNCARLLALAVVSLSLVFALPTSAGADPEDICDAEEWHEQWQDCLEEAKSQGNDDGSWPPGDTDSECKEPPIPGSPDSGMAGWFASEPDWYSDPAYQDGNYTVPSGQYSKYGYAGYELPQYDMGCFDSFVPDGDGVGNSLANLEFTMSTGIIGASNGLREAAWDPGGLWGWADDFIETASQAIMDKVFSVFGAITLVLVGLYLIWRSRQADMSIAVTTAGWAVLVMVLVIAVAQWPVQAAERADSTLVAGLSTVQSSLDPVDTAGCTGTCEEVRTPAEKSSDMVTGEVLYLNWIRATLGQDPEPTYLENNDGEPVNDDNGDPIVDGGNAAYKYGAALYDAQALSWEEVERARSSPGERSEIIEQKQEQWQYLAETIKEEDPEAYESLTGAKGWDRVGAGFLALLSAIFFALFDITASLLIILGFLMIRWAIVAIPLLGTIAMLRPASGGFKRMMSAVLAAAINVVVFGIAAVVYLFAVAQILSASLAGWLQVLLIGLTGIVGWMLLRPYRRVTSLRGGSSIAEAAFGRRRHTEKEKEKVIVKDHAARRESDSEEPPDARGDPKERRESTTARSRRSRAETAADSGGDASAGLPPRPTPGQGTRSEPPRRAGSRANYSVYRPSGERADSRAGDRPMATVRPD